MQQVGTMGKRRKHNVVKIKSMSEVSYNEYLDSACHQPKAFTTITEQDIRLQFSASKMLEHRRRSDNVFSSRSYSRITRDPAYHDSCNSGGNTFAINNDDAANEPIGSPLERKLPGQLQNREHFLDECAMRRLKQVIFLGATSGALPWTWNRQQCRIDKWSPSMEKLWKIQWLVVTCLTCVLSLFQLYIFNQRLAMVKDSYRGVFQSSLSLLCYIWAVSFNVNLYFYKEAIRKYINTMLAFNQTNAKQYVINLHFHKMSGRLAINVLILTNISQVFATISVFLRMPYQSWYLFSYIYPKPWYWLIPGAVQEYTVVGQVIASYTLLLWIVIAHSNTVQFWLKEIHKNNDSDYTSDELRIPKNSIHLYKQLLILNNAFNECMAPMAVPLLMFHMSSALVPCGYVLIRSINHLFLDEFPAILTYPIGVWDCAPAAFIVITMAAGVFDFCSSFIHSWSNTKNKDFRRILISCPTIKMWVGHFYFLTVTSTLTFFKIVFDIITDFIIACP